MALFNIPVLSTFEPLKLITLGLAILLLAPLGFVFWQIAVFQPRPEAERRAELEALLQERAGEVGTTQDGGISIQAATVMTVESIGFFESTEKWLNFYPHRWAGVVGLAAIATIMVCLFASLFFTGHNAMVASQPPSPPPATDSQQ